MPGQERNLIPEPITSFSQDRAVNQQAILLEQQLLNIPEPINMRDLAIARGAQKLVEHAKSGRGATKRLAQEQVEGLLADFELRSAHAASVGEPTSELEVGRDVLSRWLGSKDHALAGVAKKIVDSVRTNHKGELQVDPLGTALGVAIDLAQELAMNADSTVENLDVALKGLQVTQQLRELAENYTIVEMLRQNYSRDRVKDILTKLAEIQVHRQAQSGTLTPHRKQQVENMIQGLLSLGENIAGHLQGRRSPPRLPGR